MKCNTDGASKGNSGESVCGFCIRNKIRDPIYAQEDKIGISMNIEAKARAIQEALRFSAMNSLQNILIKIYSFTLKKIIQQTWRVQWEIGEIINKIIKEVQQQNFTNSIYFLGGQSNGGLFS